MVEDIRNYRSVSRVLRECGFFDYSYVEPETLERKRQRGIDVAVATMLLDHGRDWHHYQGRDLRYVVGEVEAWKYFKKEFKFKPYFIEYYLRDHTRRIKGQLDRNGPSIYGEITVEIKLPEWKSWHGLQLAIYEYMLNGCPADLDSTDRRWVITLRPDGRYHPHKFTDRNDLRIFLEAEKYGLNSEAVVIWLKSHRR